MRFEFLATKRKRQKIRCLVQDKNFSGNSAQYKPNWLTKTLLIFGQGLPANSAGADRTVAGAGFIDIGQGQRV